MPYRASNLSARGRGAALMSIGPRLRSCGSKNKMRFGRQDFRERRGAARPVRARRRRADWGFPLNRPSAFYRL